MRPSPRAVSVLILRSAQVQKVPQTRACVRVSKNEDEPLRFALMVRDASQRAAAADAFALALRCDARQHEGGRARAGERKHMYVDQAKGQPRPRNAPRTRFIVSGLLFTMTCKSPA